VAPEVILKKITHCQALHNRKEFAFDHFITQKLKELKPTS